VAATGGAHLSHWRFAVVDMQEQLERSPDAMRIRRCSVEHPFGTIKSWMGATHFLTKGLERVKTEISLHVLAYNVKRLMSLLGVAGMMEAIRAYAFFSALQRVFGAITLLIRSVSPKTRHCTLSTLKCRTTCIGGYSSPAKACF
jgi:transposase